MTRPATSVQRVSSRYTVNSYAFPMDSPYYHGQALHGVYYTMGPLPPTAFHFAPPTPTPQTGTPLSHSSLIPTHFYQRPEAIVPPIRFRTPEPQERALKDTTSHNQAPATGSSALQPRHPSRRFPRSSHQSKRTDSRTSVISYKSYLTRTRTTTRTPTFITRSPRFLPAGILSGVDLQTLSMHGTSTPKECRVPTLWARNCGLLSLPSAFRWISMLN